MKLDFDPKNNITFFDKIAMQLKNLGTNANGLISLHNMVKNWQDVALFKVGLKKAGFIMQMRNGKQITINKLEDYFQSWETKEAQTELLKQRGLEKIVKIVESDGVLKFKFKNKLVKLAYESQKQMNNTMERRKARY